MADRPLTTVQVAERLGLHPITVRRAALTHGVGRVVSHVRLYTEADVDRLRGLTHARAGRPPKVRSLTVGAGDRED